jgi:DNA invertase Pin-like site-specific DNA recombinase
MDSYTSAERKAQGRKFARARAATAEASRVSKILAQSAHAEGVPETQIAAEMGVDRMTVRAWLGKR